MLVLSRKQKQQIKIGDDVVLTVLQVKGNTVRIGIEAPKEVHVIRSELQEFPAATTPAAESKDMRKSTAPSRVPILANESVDPVEVVELKIHGGDAGLPVSNRLSEIVSMIPTLNTSR